MHPTRQILITGSRTRGPLQCDPNRAGESAGTERDRGHRSLRGRRRVAWTQLQALGGRIEYHPAKLGSLRSRPLSQQVDLGG
jgi:hypothetical protein